MRSTHILTTVTLILISICPFIMAPYTTSASPLQLQPPPPGKTNSPPSSQIQSAGPVALQLPIDVVPIPPQSHPYGASYATWGARWWQWALSAPFGSDPITDVDGTYCDFDQSGPVWYLAGSFGSATVRSCTVPAGAAIFFPIVNFYANYPCPPEFGFEPAPGQSLEEFLTEFVTTAIDGATNMLVEVDGVSLGDVTPFRATSGLIALDIDPSWAAADPCVTGAPQPAVVDGYWMMLPPLSPGAHTLHFHAELPNFGGFVLDVTYNLTVRSGRHGHGWIASDGASPSTWSLLKRLYK